MLQRLSLFLAYARDRDSPVLMIFLKFLSDHIRKHHHQFHFFFVFVVATAIVMGLFFVQLPRSVRIQAQTTLSPPPPGSVPPPPGPGPQGIFDNFDPLSVPRIFSRLACYMVRFGLIASVIAMLASGISFLLSGGNPVRYATAKKFFLYAVVGALIIYGVYTIILSITYFVTGSIIVPWIPLTCS